jgi:membrane-associated phospholipid phosphatase
MIGMSTWTRRALVFLGLELVLMVAVVIATMVLEEGVKPTRTDISPFTDLGPISHPHSPDTVHFLVVGLAIPVALVLCGGHAWIRGEKKRGEAVVRVLRVFFLGVGLTFFITSCGKVAIGRLRPDFLARCFGEQAVLNQSFTWKDVNAALGPGGSCPPVYPASVVRDGKRSFPSGHTSVSFATAVISGLYSARAVRSLLPPLATMFAALMVGLSRVADYRHHPTDVLAGALLGIIVSVWGFTLIFPRWWTESRPPAPQPHDDELV